MINRDICKAAWAVNVCKMRILRTLQWTLSRVFIVNVSIAKKKNINFAISE